MWNDPKLALLAIAIVIAVAVFVVTLESSVDLLVKPLTSVLPSGTKLAGG
jgi:hypothetical protein